MRTVPRNAALLRRGPGVAGDSRRPGDSGWSQHVSWFHESVDGQCIRWNIDDGALVLTLNFLPRGGCSISTPKVKKTGLKATSLFLVSCYCTFPAKCWNRAERLCPRQSVLMPFGRGLWWVCGVPYLGGMEDVYLTLQSVSQCRGLQRRGWRKWFWPSKVAAEWQMWRW